jgi:hypothetical protein
MKMIRSDIIKALQFVDQQQPMPAEADATANAVAWLRKNKDRLLHVIHSLATSENEAAPAAVETLMGVIHAHPPPRPLEYGSAPAMGIALAAAAARECPAPLRVRVATLLRSLALCAVCSASSAGKPTVSRSK